MKRFLSLVLGAALLLATAVSGYAATAVLTWSPNTESDLAGYKVFRSLVPGQYDYTKPEVVLDKSQTSYTATLPDPTVDTPYFFVITAHDLAANNSQPSNEVSKVIVAVAKPGVGTLTAGIPTTTSITVIVPVVLDGLGQPAKFNLRYAVSPINWGTATSTTCTVSPCVIPGLTPGTPYQVQAVWYRTGTPNVFGPISAILDLMTLPVDLPPAPPKGLIVASISEEQIIVVASRTDCPRLVTSTKGSTATQLVRTVTCTQ